VINSTKRLIVLQNVPFIIFFIFFQLVIRDKPETPPSAVAAAPIEEMSFTDSFKEMWANKNFMTLTVAYAIVYGVYCAIGTTMSNLLNPFGYTPTQISIAGGSTLLAGVIGALLIGVFLDHTSLYRKTHMMISLMTFASLVLSVVALYSFEGQLGPIMLFMMLFGISSVSFFPTSLSYGAELTFPL